MLFLKLLLLTSLSLRHHIPGQCAPGETPEQMVQRLRAELIHQSLLAAPIPGRTVSETTTTRLTEAMKELGGGGGLRAAVEHLSHPAALPSPAGRRELPPAPPEGLRY